MFHAVFQFGMFELLSIKKMQRDDTSKGCTSNLAVTACILKESKTFFSFKPSLQVKIISSCTLRKGLSLSLFLDLSLSLFLHGSRK